MPNPTSRGDWHIFYHQWKTLHLQHLHLSFPEMNPRYCEGWSCATHCNWKLEWNTWFGFHLADFLQATPSPLTDRTEGNEHKLKYRRLHLSFRKRSFTVSGTKGTHIAQEGCRVFPLGDKQKPSGHDPGQSALGGPAGAQVWIRWSSRGHFQTQPFCDSVAEPHIKWRLIFTSK